MTLKKFSLPTIAHQFLRERNSNPVIHNRDIKITTLVHEWLDSNKLKLSELDSKSVEQIMRDVIPEQASRNSREASHLSLRRYFYFLYEKGKIEFKPDYEPQTVPFELPPLAQQFLDTLKITVKTQSYKAYTSNIRQFCQFLADRSIPMESINRGHMIDWLIELREKHGFAAATKRQKIITIRLFLPWLYDNGIISVEPFKLIRPTDLPKLPKYFPRPLPPEVDYELQKRLLASQDKYHHALLLMRKTGIRFGELASLPHDCVHTDFNGINYLKVPLGKLNNERLVPLEKETVTLIEKIKTHPPENKQNLIVSPRNKTVQLDFMNNKLRECASGLDGKGKISSHRLRHTFAYSLLNADMSELGLKKLLGHRSLAMTFI